MNYTELEANVFNLIAAESMKGGLYDVSEVAEALNLPVNTVKGVIGSLTKKGKVEPDDGDDYRVPVIWPVHPIHGACFWTDMVSKEEFENALISPTS